MLALSLALALASDGPLALSVSAGVGVAQLGLPTGLPSGPALDVAARLRLERVALRLGVSTNGNHGLFIGGSGSGMVTVVDVDGLVVVDADGVEFAGGAGPLLGVRLDPAGDDAVAPALVAGAGFTGATHIDVGAGFAVGAQLRLFALTPTTSFAPAPCGQLTVDVRYTL